ncbi:MAG TPA: hypothetical protein VF701_06715 [Thermoanaerobaculia bacterium]
MTIRTAVPALLMTLMTVTPSLAAPALRSAGIETGPALAEMGQSEVGHALYDDAVIPVIGNTPGIGGSYFRTTLHLVNATDEVMEGEIVFIDPSIPPYPYLIPPGQTRFIDDLLPAWFAGLTSADVRRLRGPLPVTVAHVFNDDLELGTSGLIERAIPLQSTLAPGDRATLLLPTNQTATRFNVGLRSMGDGLAVRVYHRNSSSGLVRTFDRILPPSSLIHESFEAFAGASSIGTDSLTFEVLSGRGVIYGAATDNGTNDPNIQIAAKEEPPLSGRYILPVAGSVEGRFGSRFATGLQIYNRSNGPLSATIRFHPAGVAGSDADPQIVVNVPAFGSASTSNVVSAIGADGLGSLDVIVSGAVRPVLLGRIYSIADGGETSLMTELVPEENALRATDSGVVVAPADPQNLRFNLGVRTLAEGVRMTATVRNAEGDVIRVAGLEFPGTYFLQAPAADLLGLESFEGNESVMFTIEEGAAIVYGVWTDNSTQDPAIQHAVRP